MASYSTITTLEQQSFLDAYETLINSTADLSSAFGIGVTGEEPLYGFKIDKTDYIALMSIIGVNKWKFRFGYRNSAFIVTAEGVDSNGTRMTPIYVLEDPVHLQVNQSPADPNSGIMDAEVPDTLAFTWIHSWNNLVAEQIIPQSFFQTASGVLKGYNFTSFDVMEVLNQSNANDKTINIVFVNHSIEQQGQQATTPGYFGLMLGSATADNKYTHAFYDLSAPCPPTCL